MYMWVRFRRSVVVRVFFDNERGAKKQALLSATLLPPLPMHDISRRYNYTGRRVSFLYRVWSYFCFVSAGLKLKD